MPTRRASQITAPALPLACAVHCLSAPMLLPLAAPLVGETAEILFFAAAVLTAVAAAVRGMRSHGQARTTAPIIAGSLLWGAGLTGLLAGLEESLTTLTGALLMAAGLGWNSVLRHRTRCASCGGGAAGRTPPRPR